MTDNTNFASPTLTLETVTERINDFKEAMASVTAAEQALSLATLAREETRVELESTITQLAGYVEAASKGDKLKIVTSGMQVRGSGTPVGILPAPLGLLATANAMEGKIDLAWSRVSGSRS